MNAYHIHEDAQASKELANLLGQELISAKKRVTNLEKQLRESKTLLTRLKTGQRGSLSQGPVVELRQEIQGYKEEQARLKEQLQSLKSHSQKYMVGLPPLHVFPIPKELSQKQKQKMRDFRKQLRTMEAQREKERDEARKLKESYRDLKQRVTRSKTTAASISGVKDPFQVMSALPICSARPNHGSLLPVISKSLRQGELGTYLASDPKTQRYSDLFMFFPGRFSWCSSPQGYHHALAFGPTHVFNTQTRRWEKESLMESMYGLVKELFYVEKGKILYGGTYKCLRLRDHVIQWPDSEAEGLTSFVMAEMALSENFQNAPSSQVHKGTISKLYREGVLELDCMGLECVGFNKQLYEDLLRRNEQVNIATKKKRRSKDSAGDRAKKKRRL